MLLYLGQFRVMVFPAFSSVADAAGTSVWSVSGMCWGEDGGLE